MSTPPAPLSPNSRVYTSPSAAADPSFLSSSPLSHTTSHEPSSPDSLRSASPSEVEARALDFLSDVSHPNPTGALDPHELLPLRTAGAVSPSDLPRKMPTSEGGRRDAQEAAVAFLRRALEGAEETGWKYHTPSPFDPPHSLEPRSQPHSLQIDDGLPAREEGWAERAFNPAHYPDPTEGMSSHVSELVQQEAGLEGEGEWAEEDGETSGMDNTFDHAATRGESNAGRGGGWFPASGGRTRALVRGVSDLAMQ